MIPGEDSGPEGRLRVMQISHRLDREAKLAKQVKVEWNGKEYHVKIRYFMLFDGQLISMTSGLGGAACTMCPATKEQMIDVECIKKGFKITHNIERLNNLYYSLEKNEDGSIKKRKGMYLQHYVPIYTNSMVLSKYCLLFTTSPITKIQFYILEHVFDKL